MRRFEIIAAFLCTAIMVLLILIACALNTPAEPEPPKVDTKGLCVVEVKEPEYEMYFTEADVIALAQMLYGEARGCTVDNQMKCVWCVLNRVDDPRFPDTIQGVLEQPHQFHGYDPTYPVTDELYNVAFDVLTRWSYEKQGVPVRRELAKSYLWFTGNGVENIFREVY